MGGFGPHTILRKEASVNRETLVELYDDVYARSYDEKFYLSPLTRPESEHELQLLQQLLVAGRTWLDVECCTGYYLRHFPKVKRAGLEVSPAMQRLAQQANPGVPILLHDFRDPLPAWNDCWDLVSCMWYNYGLVDSADQLLKLIHNLASWTAPEGTCFVPLANPRLIAGVNLPYRVTHSLPFDPGYAGEMVITGILWSYVEDGGRKVHAHMLAPNVEWMVEQFERYFEKVELTLYPPMFPGWEGRRALLATRKKPSAVRAASVASTRGGRSCAIERTLPTG